MVRRSQIALNMVDLAMHLATYTEYWGLVAITFRTAESSPLTLIVANRL